MKRTKIIAEVGSNHNGNLALAKEMIEVAAECGADFVKFQSWQAKNLKRNHPDYSRHKKTELSNEDHYELLAECRKNKIRFLTTCYDIGRIDFLIKLGLRIIKVASPDAASYRMLEILKEKFEHLIISTGMTYDYEIRKTAKIMEGANYTFMHCVSIYPTPLDKTSLARMDWLRQFTPSVGFSDHTDSITASKIAICKGADFIEKHFIMNKRMRTKDKAVSIIPKQLKDLVDYAKQVAVINGVMHPKFSRKELRLRKRYVNKWGNNK